MFKRHTFWIWTAVVFQVLTAVAHSVSFIVEPVLKNETERQLFDLMATYRRDLGGGFQPTTKDLVTALSACFPLMYLLGACINGYLLRKKVETRILKGVLAINILLFGACFVIMASLTFLPPITLTGLVFFALVISYLTVPKPTPISS